MLVILENNPEIEKQNFVFLLRMLWYQYLETNTTHSPGQQGTPQNHLHRNLNFLIRCCIWFNQAVRSAPSVTRCEKCNRDR